MKTYETTYIAAWREGARGACRALALQRNAFLTESFVEIIANAMVDAAIKERNSLVPASLTFMSSIEKKDIAYESFKGGAKLVLDVASEYDIGFISDNAMAGAIANAYSVTMAKFEVFCNDHGI